MTITLSGLVYSNGVLLPWYVLAVMILIVIVATDFIGSLGDR